MDDQSRAKALRNDDTDRMCQQANGYFLGTAPEGEIVIALDIAGSPQFGLFLGRDGAIDFLDRLTAEIEAMGWLS